jgi:membrane protein YqaA with SNARE-associated domain
LADPFRSFFGLLVSWWGALLLGALDSSMLFFMPYGIDALVVILAARDEELFWLYPLLATAGSVVGAAVTFWIGRKLGEVGLERLVPKRRLERIRSRINGSGATPAVALAVPAIMPPPFPLTPFVLSCGALNVDLWRFLGIFGVARLIRFGVEAVLATIYGRGILRILESDTFQIVVAIFIVIAVVGTIVTIVMLWRKTHVPMQPAPRST